MLASYLLRLVAVIALLGMMCLAAPSGIVGAPSQDEAEAVQELVQEVFKRGRFRFRPRSEIDLLKELRKRQIRYHPCYFNPVSCFRK